jgi:hypothetical protein
MLELNFGLSVSVSGGLFRNCSLINYFINNKI